MVKSHVHYMDHKHWTDIMHSHGITDPGHAHGLEVFRNVANNTVFSGILSVYNAGDSASLRYPIQVSGTGITVKAIEETERWRLSTESRYIGNEGVNRQYTESNDANAIENRPKNYTVKIWKRTA